ncbi:DUF4383 domain-containing protein [Nostoc sphaeroides CHAB 2801]|uniref:DUF4383 domain-containing protein n=1 Tax=Nostoc sphaeroides TaxID=446679 RepID=UPI001E383E19|nr:DUF4383 domain-containing protein [Nostoc sphaeroides]MCC5633709.1 DUF4383 domain-containing protein [Nostoc sphaeroides CHAB 2801]
MLKFTYLSGLILVLVGVVGFLPNGHEILGVQPHQITVLHNLIHLTTGLGAIYFAYKKPSFIKTYFNILGCIYLTFSILGFALNNNIFNLIILAPLDNFLHFSIAILSFAVGTIIPKIFGKKKEMVVVHSNDLVY